MQTVQHVDLDRYQGQWYEVARLPLIWENKCASDVTAHYSPRPDGSIEVANTCRKIDGSLSTSKGTAKVYPADTSNLKLKVTFFWPFAGDYWILDLDPEYRWALVGTPNRRHLWLLSREPELDARIMDRMLVKAKSLGFDTSKIILTKQRPGASAR